MGHQSGKSRKPRSGSLQIWPRVRAKRNYPKIRSWPENKTKKLLGFAGYKAGMTHVIIIDNQPHSSTKGEKISIPVTVVECPPLKPLSIRLYKQTPYSSRIISEIPAKNFNKELFKKIKQGKKQKEEPKTNLEDVSDVRLSVYTQPKMTGIGKKKPEIFELAIGGKNTNEKLEFAKSLLDKEIKVTDVFKEGEFIDVHAVTKGKGFQGPVKRYGISLKSHKSQKKRRSAGNLGAWTPKKVDWRMPQHGQKGYHTRTDYNNLVIKIDSDTKLINPKGGFVNYGLIKNDYVLVKGSIPGPKKRLVRLIEPIRMKTPAQKQDISYISIESKQ